MKVYLEWNEKRCIVMVDNSHSAYDKDVQKQTVKLLKKLIEEKDANCMNDFWIKDDCIFYGPLIDEIMELVIKIVTIYPLCSVHYVNSNVHTKRKLFTKFIKALCSNEHIRCLTIRSSENYARLEDAIKIIDANKNLGGLGYWVRRLRVSEKSVDNFIKALGRHQNLVSVSITVGATHEEMFNLNRNHINLTQKQIDGLYENKSITTLFFPNFNYDFDLFGHRNAFLKTTLFNELYNALYMKSTKA